MEKSRLDKKVTAIVLDANAFSRGLPSFRDLSEFATLAKDDGLEVWLPEVVTWELAQHVSALYEETRIQVRSARNQLLRANVELPAVPDNHSLIDQVIAQFHSIDGVAVIRCRAESALQGLKDQVMQTVPGKLKGDTKTGAADGTWLRDIQSEVDCDTSRYVLVSNDRDVLSAFKYWKVDPPRLLSDLGQARRELFFFDVDSNEAVERVLKFLYDALFGSKRGAIDFGQIDVPGWSLDLLFPDLASHVFGQSFADIQNILALLGLFDVQVSRTRATIAARLIVGVDVVIEAAYLIGDGDMQISGSLLRDACLAVDMTFTCDATKRLIGHAQVNGVAQLMRQPKNFAGPGEALSTVRDHLLLIPGIDDPVALKMTSPGQVQIAETSVESRFAQHDQGWSLKLTDTDLSQSITVVCKDDAGATTATDWVVPSYLYTDWDVMWANPAWAANAFILSRMTRKSGMTLFE